MALKDTHFLLYDSLGGHPLKTLSPPPFDNPQGYFFYVYMKFILASSKIVIWVVIPKIWTILLDVHWLVN